METTAVITGLTDSSNHARLGLFRLWADRLICSRLPIFHFVPASTRRLMIFRGDSGDNAVKNADRRCRHSKPQRVHPQLCYLSCYFLSMWLFSILGAFQIARLRPNRHDISQ